MQFDRVEQLEDPMWEYVLASKLSPYLEAVRKFWDNITDIEIKGTGVHDVSAEYNPPAGLMYRVTNTPVRSPIKGIQVFPFVPTSFLQISGIPGGVCKMIQRVCADNKFTMEEFTLIEKSNLPSTYHQGQFIAFIPTAILEENAFSGKWVYMTKDEMVSVMQGLVPLSVQNKIIKYL